MRGIGLAILLFNWGITGRKELVGAFAASSLLHLALDKAPLFVADIKLSNTPLPIKITVVRVANTILAHRELTNSISLPVIAVKNTFSHNIGCWKLVADFASTDTRMLVLVLVLVLISVLTFR